MSSSTGALKFKYGEIKYYRFDGTRSIAISRFYDTYQELIDNWKKEIWIDCTCGKEEPVIFYTNEAGGYYFNGMACKYCRSARSEYEFDIIEINETEHWAKNLRFKNEYIFGNMKKVNTVIEVKHFVGCPHCQDHNNRIDHLFNDENREIDWGPWYCDKCGGSYKGMVKGKEVFIEPITDGRQDNSIVFLKNGNILLVVKGMYFNGKHDIEQDRFFYNEHTCPINYLKNIEMVINLENGDTDPHGIFEFVDSIPYKDSLPLKETVTNWIVQKEKQLKQKNEHTTK